MPRYEVVLFDADHTLFDFDRAEREALRQTLEEAGLPADGETEARYLSINRALWNRLDRGEVRREWLVVERFAALLRALRPFVREERRAGLDRALQIVGVTRIIRAALETMGGKGEEGRV